MTRPALSVVIPTYNRAAQLELLLADLGRVMEKVGSRLQVVVSDNASTDRTAAVLKAHQAAWPSTLIVTRPVNIGMEGNIACAMLEGDGRYVWMLSDHQRLNVAGSIRLMSLLETVEFDIGHAKVAQWHAALPAQERVMDWSTLSARERGALLFSLGNLSTLIYRRELAQASAKAIFKTCFWSYPHLGIICQIKEETRLIEFDNLSCFPSATDAATMTHDYDKLSVRYRGNFNCVRSLAEQANFTFDPSGFFTPDYRASFRTDVLLLLLNPSLSRISAARSLLPLLLNNPLPLKAIVILVFFSLMILPKSLRIRLAKVARTSLKQRTANGKTQADCVR